MGYLVDIAKTVPITIGDYDFCKIDPVTGKRKNTGWHTIEYDDAGNITQNNIKICSGLPKRELLDTAKHELWHQAYFTRLNDTERKEYNDLHTASTKPWDFKQAYSQQNPIEDYADTFSSAFSNKNLIRTPLFTQKLDTIKKKFNLFDFSAK